jgi:hypothetical protein
MFKQIPLLRTVSASLFSVVQRILCLLIVLLPVFSGVLHAQISGTGTIQGTVTDSTGAVVPRAAVRVLEVRTNALHNQTVTNSGFYSVAGLPPGTYVVTVAAQGFESHKQENVSVDALQVVGLDIQLAVGRAETTVTVSTAPTPINTTNATLGSSMETETYKALPLNMSNQPRDPTGFLQLSPGIEGGSGTNQFNGGQSFNNETYIDGLAMTDPTQTGDWAQIHSTFSVDAVDQFQAQTSGISASYAGQGIQNYVHKSGTNSFHGSLFEYFRNTALDTWGFSAPYVINPITGTAIKPVEHNNEFGGTIGGPILRNKIFFFFSYDNEHFLKGTNPGQVSIPTVLERNGDFTELPAAQTVYDPTTTVCVTSSNCTRKQFMGMKNGVPTANVIPASRLSPIAQYEQKFLPAPSNGNLTNNYLGGFNTGFNYPRYSGKLDLDLFKAHRISFTFLVGGRYANPACCDGSGLPLPYTATVGNTQNSLTGIIGDTWTINDHMLNQFKFGNNLTGFNGTGSINPSGIDSSWAATAAGITNLPPGQASQVLPSTTFSGSNAPLSWANANTANSQVVFNEYLQDTVQIVKGKQSITIGGEYQWLASNVQSISTGTLFSQTYSPNETSAFKAASGTLNTVTGASYASFLLGALDSAGVTDNRPASEIGARYRSFSPFFQDDWKISQKLTVNLGLRWDLYTPFHEAHDKMSFLNLGIANPVAQGAMGALMFAGSSNTNPSYYCNCHTPIQTWYKNFGPRVGFAYAIDPKTVVRGSYGIAYTRAGGVGGRGNATTGISQLGFNGAGTFASQNGGITPAFYLNNSSDFTNASIANTAVPSITPPVKEPQYGTGNTITSDTSFTFAGSAAGVSFADPYLSRRAPYFENWSFGFQRDLYKGTILSVDYAGSGGHFLGTSIGRGPYGNQLTPAQQALGSLLNQPDNATNAAAAAAILPGFKQLPYPNFNTAATIAQALRPFSQYNGVSDIWGDIGNSNYNALQLQVKSSEKSALTYDLSYTWAKMMDDTGTSRSSYGINGDTAGGIEHSLSTLDISNHLTGYLIYREGFGRGNGFWLTNQIIKNWSISGIYTYTAGFPLVFTASGCTVVDSGTCMPTINPNFTGPIRLNGGYGRKNLATFTTTPYLANAASNPTNLPFSVNTTYGYGNASRTYTYHLRGPGRWNGIDASLRRAFDITEKVKFNFEASAFNLTNHNDFSAPNTSFTPTSTTFGTVTGTSITGRSIMFAARIDF